MERKFITVKISDVAKNVKHLPSQIKLYKAFIIDSQSIVEGIVVEGEHIEYTLKLIKEELPYERCFNIKQISYGNKTSILKEDAKRIQKMIVEELEYRTPVYPVQSVLFQHNGITNYFTTQ